MKTSGNTVLITGGATGIGFALAKAFLEAGNTVIICGRREARLKEAKQMLPKLNIKVCDISKEEERAELFNFIKKEFNALNILVNNAGIQRKIDFKKGTADVLNIEEEEIAINLVAPIALSAYFVPLLETKGEAAIINITSALGLVPLAIFPIYSATKAALHSFSISLRHQLKPTSIKVFEVICSTTESELKSAAGNAPRKGMPAQEMAKEFFASFEKDEFEMTCGEEARNLRINARSDPDKQFDQMNSW